jgi:hypothetical protein
MRKHAAHSHPDEVRVLAIVADPLFKLRLVRALDRAAVDVPVLPPMTQPPKALPKASRITRRVAKGEPDDFGPFVGQRAFGNVPDLIGDGAGLVWWTTVATDPRQSLVEQWGEAGMELTDATGPRDWQRELLAELGPRLREGSEIGNLLPTAASRAAAVATLSS